MTLPGTVRLYHHDKREGYVRVRPTGSNVDVRFDTHAIIGAPSLQRGDRVRVTLQRAGRRYVVARVETAISPPRK